MANKPTPRAAVSKFSARLNEDHVRVTIAVDLTDVDFELAIASGGYSLIGPVRLALMQAMILAPDYEHVADDHWARTERRAS